MNPRYNLNAEWLEADGLGGFASGTVSGVRTRRYHALLLPATRPPTGRVTLVNGFDAWVETPAGEIAISSQRYTPDIVHPDGLSRLSSFEPDPWPRWRYQLASGLILEQEIFVPHERAQVVLTWRLSQPTAGARLFLRPLLSGRDYHSLHHENGAFRFDADVKGPRCAWRPYAGVPGIIAQSNGTYRHEPSWYRGFQYDEERARGLDFTEDLASPGVFEWDISVGEAAMIFTAEGLDGSDALVAADASRAQALEEARRLKSSEKTRREIRATRLERSADAYFVRRGRGKTIVAGYPWFTDWGRDTFIALRGLALATGRLGDARDILVEWAGTVSEGMLPNRFPDSGEASEFNSVDASLWYVVAVGDFFAASEKTRFQVSTEDRRALEAAVEQILSGYSAGTRHGIRLDLDGLLLAGEPGQQLTWMDAKVGDWVVTPRRGKPVEVEALWLNALSVGSRIERSKSTGRWREILERGLATFRARFWNAERNCLFDVIDVDGQPNTADATIRPNQIFAVGGLPQALLEPERARSVIDVVESSLWTPLGLRSLAPGEPGYAPRYEGGVRERDCSYHQGTVWPWLIGPFVEAWVRSRGSTNEARRTARERFLSPLIQHLDEAGLGHVSEIADADPPHAPRGCPFQAWSLGEVLRLELSVLREESETLPRGRHRKTSKENPDARIDRSSI